MATAATAVTPPRRGALRGTALLAGAAAALLVVAVVHLGQGSSGIGWDQLIRLVTGDAPADVQAIFTGSRLPRLLTGLVAGAALAVSGSLAQAATRNPLASPETLGVNAGGYLAVTAAAAAGVSLGSFGSVGLATVGGLAAAVGVWALAGRKGLLSAGRVLLAGSAVTMALMSLVTLLLVMFEQNTQGLYFWGNGSIAAISSTRAAHMAVLLLALGAAAMALARPLDLLALGDDGARALGARTGAVKLTALGLAVLSAAAAVTAAGPIGFVGVVAPVVVRLLGVHRHVFLVPTAAVLGAALLLTADVFARMFLRSASAGELPAGIITALIGAPVFIALARRLKVGNTEDQAAVVARRRLRLPVVVAVALAGLALCALAALRLGDVAVTWSQIGDWLRGLDVPVVDRRFARFAVAAAAGACLAVAGVAIQSVVRNPIAEPSIIGITGGAGVGAVGALTIAPHAPAWVLPLATLAGGVATTAFLLLAAGRRSGGSLTVDPTRVVLVGLGFAAFTTAVITVLALHVQLAVNRALIWLAGSTYGRTLEDARWLIAPLALAVVLTLLGRSLDLLAYGEDTPRSLGLSLGRARLAILMSGAFLAAGAAAVVGAVGFVGLVAPHTARALVGPAHRRLIPVAALFGALLVVAADIVGRSLLAPREIPVGLVVALVGAPYLAWLLRRSNRAAV